MLIVIDSFHSWAIADATGEEERQLFERLLRELGDLAEELNASIILIAERNRTNARTAGLSSAAGTRKFEYCAELVVDLERYDPEEEGDAERGNGRQKRDQKEKPNYTQAVMDNPENRRPVRLWVLKNRHGASDFYIETEFIGQKMRFEEVDGDEPLTVAEELEQKSTQKAKPVFGDPTMLARSRTQARK